MGRLNRDYVGKENVIVYDYVDGHIPKFDKMDRIINMLGKRRELGVKVTIVTWHPDAYKYGKDDVRMELMERLRKAGFEIRLVEESCELVFFFRKGILTVTIKVVQ